MAKKVSGSKVTQKTKRRSTKPISRIVRNVSVRRATTKDEIEWDSGAEIVRRLALTAPVRRSAPSPYENRDNAYRREAYRLIQRFLRRKDGSVIKRIVQLDENEPKSPSFEQNPFYWGLLAIDPHGDFLNSKRLYRFSRHLLYASHHNIPPELLAGFLHQCGSPDRICEKANDGFTEPWLADYKAYLAARSLASP